MFDGTDSEPGRDPFDPLRWMDEFVKASNELQASMERLMRTERKLFSLLGFLAGMIFMCVLAALCSK